MLLYLPSNCKALIIHCAKPLYNINKGEDMDAGTILAIYARIAAAILGIFAMVVFIGVRQRRKK